MDALLVVALLEGMALILAMVLLFLRRPSEKPTACWELSRSMQEMAERIGRLTELTELTHDVTCTLERVMSGERSRGRLGELMLEHVLRGALPPDAYRSQVMIGSERVDFVVDVGGVLVPIDCKFPHASYERMLSARDANERERCRAELLRHVKAHIDAVSRYVQPQRGTSDVALMYVPTEGVYLSIVQDAEILRYAHEKNVVLCSPASIHYVLFVLGDLVRRGRLPEVLEGLDEGLKDMSSALSDALDEFSTLERHLTNAGSKTQRVRSALEHLGAALDRLEKMR